MDTRSRFGFVGQRFSGENRSSAGRGGRTLGAFAITSALVLASVVPAIPAAAQPTDDAEALARVLGSSLLDIQLANEGRAASGNPSSPAAQTADIDVAALNSLLGINLPAISVPLIRSGGTGILDLGPAAGAGLLNAYSVADSASHSVASAGAVGSDGAVNTTATSNPSTIGSTRAELTALISQLGLGSVTDGVLDQVRVELGALASRAEQTAPGAATLDYRLAGGRIVIHSPAIAGLSTTLTTAVTGVQTTLNSALSSTAPGSVGSVLGAVSLNATVLAGVAGVTGGPATATATVSLAPVAAALLATPLVSTDGIVSINLGTGDITVDIAKLLKGPAATDLNGLAANTQVLTTTTINAIVAGIGSSLNLLAPSAVSLITTALNSTTLTISLPATLTVAFIPSSIGITVTGTLGQLSTVGATPTVNVTGNILGLNLTALSTALVAPLIPVLITPLQPVLATLLTTTANGLGTTVAGIVTPVITALGPVVNPVLSRIAQLTINEQTSGDLGATSATVRALALRLIPTGGGGQLARVDLASSSVRAAGPSPDVPAISASPDSLRAGQTLSVAGSEWPANSQVTVAYTDSAGAAIGTPHTVTTDASGNFTDTLVIPAGTPLGTIAIVATNAGGATANDTATVLATPAIDASPASVPQQGTVAVTGSGWTPNSSVSLAYTDSAGNPIGAPHVVPANGTGAISDSLVLPAGTPAGTLSIAATGVGTETAADSVTVEVAPLLDASPLSVSAGDTITVTSSGWPGSEQVEVIYRDSAGTAIGAPHTVTTLPTGGFTDTLVVPPGTIAGPLNVVADDDGGRVASDAVTVVIAPVIDATPAVVQAPATVTVAGSGWPANTSVTLVYRDSANTPIGAPHTVTSSPTGTMTDSLVVPVGTVLGTLPVTATDAAGDTASDSVVVVASPSIAAQQPSVPRGGSVAVDGTAWPANSTVNLTYTDAAGDPVGAVHTVTTSGTGTFTDTLNVPAGTALGPIAISATNGVSTDTDTVTVTPTPTLTASPESVPVEGTVAVTTTGWPPSTPITITYTDSAGTLIATHPLTSSPTGTLTDSLDVPAGTPPGTISIAATDPAGDTASDSVLLEVAPVLTAAPAQVHGGDTLSISSSGWPANESVNLVFADADGDLIGLPVPATTSAAGTFTVTFVVPPGTDTGPLSVTAADADGRAADDNVTVLATPTLDASPASVPAGATIITTGGDWVPGSIVTIVYTDSAGTVIATRTVNADGLGAITDPLVVPVGTPPGSLSISATDTVGGVAGAGVTVEVAPVLTASPATVSPGGTVSVVSTGWPVNTPVQVSYTDADDDPIGAPHPVVTSAAGVLTDTLVVPIGTTPGALTVVAVDGIGRTATDTVDVVLNPTLVAAPATVPQGGTITVTGDDWDPGSTVTVVYTDSAGTAVASHDVIVDPAGQLTDSLALPPGVAVGALVVSGDDGNGTDATDTVDVEAPVQLSASPTTAGPGSTITATGTGWPANTTVTVTYVDSAGNPVGAPHTATTDGTGGFTDTLVVPGGTPAGPLVITADDGAGRVATDTVTVALTPTISAAPASARPGDVITVIGTGWPANTAVTVTYTDDDGNPIGAPHAVTTGGNGTFTDTVTIPATVALGALDVAANGGGFAAADVVEVSNVAAIAADQNTVVPGATLDVSGSGWDPNTFVTLVYRDSAGNQIGAAHTVITSATGALVDSLSVPSSTPAGELTIDASDADGATASDTVDVVRTATLIATPGSVQPGDTVTVTGDGWPPSSTVTVTYNDTAGNPIGTPHTVTTDPDGHFVDVFVVPAGSAEGPIAIVASEPGGGTAATSVTVDIGPGIAAMEETAQGGEEIAVSGSGWLPNSPVSIEYWGSDGTMLDVTHVVTTDATGRLTDTIIVPGLAASGDVTIRATGVGGDNDEDTFQIVIRQLVPRVLRIARGQTLPIWVGGWPGQQDVTVTYTDAGGEQLDENIVTTTEEGEAVDELVLPDSTDIGPMLVEVTDQYGAVLGVTVEVVEEGSLIPNPGAVTPAASGSRPSGLAFTGSDPSWPISAAAALVALGMLVMMVGRRRVKNRQGGFRTN